ncbi:hypothetical protein ACXU4B_04325 [Dyella soli]|uniref:Uncharacterized protein n=1 Tax=Dyella soli TaxID=522319 RepID=A0A4R0YQN1_9GAMM|nr:hypothetical protein [Dyella soli]TCI10245.1 hypothetical protein EZM97_15205 [Dyella soli]
MKLQIEGQNLRVRIGEEELSRLLAGHAVEARTSFAQAFVLGCTLQLGPGDAAEVSGTPGAWHIRIPQAAVVAHAARLPTREGLRFELAGGADGDALVLLFDVDVRDSVRQRRTH